MVAGKSDVKHASYAWEDSGESTLLIMPELCPGQWANQMSVREGKMRTFDIFMFYRWLQFISKVKKNIVIEHVGVVFAQLTGADGRSAVPQR